MTDTQKNEFFKLLDTAAVEVVPAVRITTPPDFPESAAKAIRFLVATQMERIGVSLNIFFSTRDNELEAKAVKAIYSQMVQDTP